MFRYLRVAVLAASHRSWLCRNALSRSRIQVPSYLHIQVPAPGQKISVNADMLLKVPAQSFIPSVEGDGTGKA